MSNIHIGCQTYTWEMLGNSWTGSVEDMVMMISNAGYAGIEITNTMIGRYYDDPDGFKALLKTYNLDFPAFGFAPLGGFTRKEIIEKEIENIMNGIRFVSHFPGTHLVLAGGSSENRDDFDEKFETMCSIYTRAGKLGAENNVPIDVHAHSHAGSIIETEEEYDRLMRATDAASIGWNPDSGHIVRGGVDLPKLLKKYQKRIRHVHIKDADSEGRWKKLGEGIIDFREVFALLEEMNYKGWVIGEEESADAWNDQYESILHNRKYIASLGH
jgi:sugar phosphate isomerase/epimerase